MADPTREDSRDQISLWRRLRSWLGTELTPVRIAALGLLVLGLVVLGWHGDEHRWHPSLFLQRFYSNAGTDMFSIAVTVLIIDQLYATRQRQESQRELKERLIRDMGSQVRDVAVHAADELGYHGWLYDGSLKAAFLIGANLQEARLIRANLQKAILWNANLQKSFLFHAYFQKSLLAGANLRDATLVLANLQKAALWDANLQGANLRDADLRGAYLQNANLQGTTLRGAKLEAVSYDTDTIWPEGFDPEAAGAVRVPKGQPPYRLRR